MGEPGLMVFEKAASALGPTSTALLTKVSVMRGYVSLIRLWRNQGDWKCLIILPLGSVQVIRRMAKTRKSPAFPYASK